MKSKQTVSLPDLFDQDEEEIQKILNGGRHTHVTTNIQNNNALAERIIHLLTSEHIDKPVIVTITGGPASGKSTLRTNLLEKLKMLEFHADYVSTDDFGMFRDRIERDQKIADGLDPYDAKDWKYLEKIIVAVREGKSIAAPIYDEKTGAAVGVGEENFPHRIPSNLDFFFIEGDFQPLIDPDIRIYFHVPTLIRRENRVMRDLAKRNGKSREAVEQSFDYRLTSQYYPHTLPHAERADILIITQAVKTSTNRPHPYRYTYTVYQRNNI